MALSEKDRAKLERVAARLPCEPLETWEQLERRLRQARLAGPFDPLPLAEDAHRRGLASAEWLADFRARHGAR